ncbi:MAG: GNAT family N-acetyltransferase [Synergistes sp.]|nr:GNAT family N-acetyltransferase [Synergistes sp.]
MERSRAFDENLYSFVSMLGGAPGGGRLEFSGVSLAVSSGRPYAGENYALFGMGAKESDVDSAAAFFRGRCSDFIVPLLPQTPFSLTAAFESNNLERRRIYTSMILPEEQLNEKNDALSDDIVEISNRDALDWGSAAWFAFGGEAGEEADSYKEYGAWLALHPDNRAFALKHEGRFVSTALIHETRRTFGLYYFATLPEYRRKGFAARLMGGLTAVLAGGEKPLVLLATEQGFPFYLSCGFKVIDRVPVCSTTDDI